MQFSQMSLGHYLSLTFVQGLRGSLDCWHHGRTPQRTDLEDAVKKRGVSHHRILSIVADRS